MTKLRVTDSIWLTRTEAADVIGCSEKKITNISREMVALGLDGVWMQCGRLYRIEQTALQDYLYHRHKIRCDERFSRPNEA